MNLNPPSYQTQFALGSQFLPDSAKGFILFGKLALEYFLAMFSLPLEVCLRWRWGVRALSLFQVQCLVFIGLLGFRAGLLGMIFLLGVAGLGVWHYVEARRWENRFPAVPWRMSFSFGEPLVWQALVRYLVRRGMSPRWATDSLIFRAHEPGTGLVLGCVFLVLPFGRLVGIVLLISGAALLMKRHLIHVQIVDATRDRRDAVVVGEVLSAEADEERRELGTETVFEVKLAVPHPVFRPAPAVPPTEPPAPVAPPLARVVGDPDASGRLKVECPGCDRGIRCPIDHAGRTLKCPACEAPFVVAP